VPIVFKSGNLNLLEPSGPVKGCNGIALPFCFTSNNTGTLLSQNISLYMPLFSDLVVFLTPVAVSISNGQVLDCVIIAFSERNVEGVHLFD
jgi:hypothetical protein